jgi:hypothetical protein
VDYTFFVFLENAITTLVLALAIAPVTMTIARTKFFAPFRDWVMGKDKPEPAEKWKKWVHEWIGYLVSCNYCLAHWFVLVGYITYRPLLLCSGNVVMDHAASFFALLGMTALVSKPIGELVPPYKEHKPLGKMRPNNHVDKEMD